MQGPIATYLSRDHDRLGDLLQRCVARSGVELPLYDEFRAGLLRHIGMEEKILLPFARQLRGDEPLPAADQLKRDHAALAALLVPSPTPQIIETIHSILVEHNKLEEVPGGVYEECEQLAGDAGGSARGAVAVRAGGARRSTLRHAAGPGAHSQASGSTRAIVVDPIPQDGLRTILWRQLKARIT